MYCNVSCASVSSVSYVTGCIKVSRKKKINQTRKTGLWKTQNSNPGPSPEWDAWMFKLFTNEERVFVAVFGE